MIKNFSLKRGTLCTVLILLLQIFFSFGVATGEPKTEKLIEEKEGGSHVTEGLIGKSDEPTKQDMDYRSIEQSDQKQSSPWSYLWLTILISAAGAIAGALFFRKNTRKRFRPKNFPRESVSSRPPTVRKFIVRKPKSGTKPQSTTHGELTVNSESDLQITLPLLSEGAKKICPQCNREYGSDLALCPFDSEKLLSGGYSETKSVPTDRLDTSVGYMFCETCSRKYDVGTRFCPYDKGELELKLQEDSFLLYAARMKCPSCNEEYEPGSCYCAKDNSRLVALDVELILFAPVPLLICPECQGEYTPEISTCSEDGALLLPLLGRRSSGMPMSGLGKKNKWCPECGIRYLKEMQFCGRDGSVLLKIS